MSEPPTGGGASRFGRTFWLLAALFLAGSLGIALIGRTLYLQERREIRADRSAELKAVSQLKIGQLASWREERTLDARVFAAEAIGPAALSWLQDTNDAVARSAVLDHLQRCGAIGGYRNLILASPEGRLLLAQHAPPTQLEPGTRALVQQAAAARSVVVGDFFRCAESRDVVLDVAAPILDAARHPVAVLLLRSDPGRHLYPLIQTWPTPSRSAETLMVRRDGDSVIFLNLLRHRTDPPLTVRLPLRQTNTPAISGVLGRIGPMEGRDYRGVAVLADIRPVPDTPWIMVSKVDTDEILAEADYRSKVIQGFVVLVILLCGAMLALLFYFGQASLYQQLFRIARAENPVRAVVPATIMRRTGRLAYLMPAIVLTIGALGLLGWILDLDILKSVVPGRVAMKANSAVGLIFAALALSSLTWAMHHDRLPWCARTYASVPLLIGLATFAEHACGVDLGIDQLLFTAPAGMVGSLAPGRMAPVTALAFVLAGCALLLISARRTGRLAQGLTLLMMLLASVPLLSYLYGAPNLQGLGRYTQMAGHTAVAFLFLGVGIFCLRPAEGLTQVVVSDSLGGWLLRRLLPFVVLVPLVIGWLRAIGEHHGWYEGTYGVALTMALLMALLLGTLWWSARALSRIDGLRLQNELQVRESREVLRATLYGIGDGVIATDPAGIVRQMNPVAEELTGWREEEAHGRPLSEVFRIVNEDTRATVDNPVGQVLRSGRIVGLANHTLLLARDGQERPIADSGAPIYNAQGEIVGVVLVFRDQTEARTAERKLQIEMHKLDTIFECAPIAMLVLNEHASIVWANSAVAALAAGVPPSGSLPGQQVGAVLRCVHRSQDPRGCGYSDDCPLCPLRRCLTQALASGKALHGEDLAVELLRQNVPTKVWLRIGVEPILLNGTRHIIVALDDISARREIEQQMQAARVEAQRLLALSEQSRLALLSAAEDREAMVEALRKSEENLELALQSAQMGVWQLDLQAGRRIFDRQTCALLGLDPKTFRGTPDEVYAAVHPDDRAKLQTSLVRVLAEDLPFTLEFRAVWPDGSVRQVTSRGRVVRDEVGRPQFLKGIVWDSTEHRQLEEMRIAKETADAASRAKSAFLAHMSHEIRTPLNAILGFAQLLLRDPVITLRQRRQLETISQSGEHLLALINDVLAMSRIEAGRLALHTVAIDCRALLADVALMFQPRLEARRLQFELQCAAGLPPFVRTDPGKLREVLINLLGNAIKFTRHGKVVLRADAARDADGVRLLFEVEDTGPGITPEDQARLFRYFEQTRTGSTAETGSGLGLAISRELVRLMGGEISFTSEVGRGSIFRFHVRVEPADHADPQTAAAARHVVGLGPGTPPIRALVVDDRPENRDLLVQFLEPAGFACRQAASGREALDLFAAWHPHLILLDLRMPEMDGLEVIRQIRPRPGGRDVRIVVVTASVLAEKRQEVLDGGADAFFVKPFQEQDLFEEIARLLHVALVWSDTAAPPPPGAVLTPAELAALSRALRQDLRAAILRGDFDRVQELIGQAAEATPAVAQALRALAERFDARRLLELLEDDA